MPLSRRDWLAYVGSAGLASLCPSTRLWAVPVAQGCPRLVVVLLRGAYDGLSTLVPYSEPFYYESRPHIAISPPAAVLDATHVMGTMRLDGRWALHPALADTAGVLFTEKQLAFVPFCGAEYVSRSHFQAQDWLEAGQLPEQRTAFREGFLNRLLQQLGGSGLSFTQNLPVIMRGAIKVANAPLGRAGLQQVTDKHVEQVLSMYRGHALEALARKGLGLRRALAAELREEMASSSREAMQAGSFAMEAQRVARHFRAHKNITVAFLEVGGWDTHAAQGAERGQLANRLDGLGAGLEAFATEMGRDWQDTVVVVLSEFGRTFRENGSGGTDHGHGNVMWVAGGAINGGIRGEQTSLSSASLHQGRDMPVLNVYRAVLGGLFARMFDLKSDAISQIFPGSQPLDLGLI